MVLSSDLNDLDESKRKEEFEAILNCFGNVDVLINNAGMIQLGFAKDLTRLQIQNQMQLNYVANICTTQSVVDHWLKTGYAGRVIINSSLSAYLPAPLYGAYSASKMALNVSFSTIFFFSFFSQFEYFHAKSMPGFVHRFSTTQCE